MKTTQQKVNLEDYILAVLSPQERLEAALKIAQQAFKTTSLTLGDIEAATRKVRRKLYAERQKEAQSRR